MYIYTYIHIYMYMYIYIYIYIHTHAHISYISMSPCGAAGRLIPQRWVRSEPRVAG